MQKGRLKGPAPRGASIAFGDFGLRALEHGKITNQQIEAARIAITRELKKGGKLKMNIFPHLALTKKPLETRQGKGKGNVDSWVAVVKTGKIMFELSQVDEATAREAFRLAAYKLPIKCKFVKKEENSNED